MLVFVYIDKPCFCDSLLSSREPPIRLWVCAPILLQKAPVPAPKGSNSGEGASGLSWRDPSENRVRPIVAWWSQNRPPLQRRCTSLNKEGTTVKQISVSPRALLWFLRSSLYVLSS